MIAKIVMCTALAANLGGCASMRTIIVDFDMEGFAALDGSGARANDPERALLKVARRPGELSPYPRLVYTGSLFSAKLSINSDTISGEFLNNSGEPLTLRFDQASVSSNQHPAPLPLQAWSGRVGQVHVFKGKASMPLRLPLLVVPPGASASLVIAPFFQGLYPSGRLFGVQFEKSAPEIVTSGVGNTWQLSVPVEWKGETLAWKINVKAIKESARTSYR